MKFAHAIFALIVGVLMFSTPSFAGDTQSIGPELKINRANGDKCVEPTDVMRKDHMEFLLHQRDETMYDGIRTKKYSLNECIECHANKDEKGKYIPVTAEGEFCQSCHTYASVKLDCFECHATKPRQVSFHPIVNEKMQSFADVHMRKSSTLLNDIANARKADNGHAQ